MISAHHFLGVLALGAALPTPAARFEGRRPGWGVLWRLASVIGAARIAALWLGAAALRSPDFRQIAGYFVLMVDLPDIYLVRGLRGNPREWVIAASVVLAVTSFLWARTLIWLRDRLR